jgi:ribonuclease BN (tRNA processing enzyme)
VGSLSVTARLVTHTAESYAIRVAPAGVGAPGIIYTGDCGRAGDVEPLVHAGDTLLAEVSFGAGPVPRGVAHLDGPAVGRLATATGVGRVLLTHILLGHDPEAAVASCRAAYDGPVEMVWPGSQADV